MLTHASFPARSGQAIRQLWVSPEGTLWVVTEGGIFSYGAEGWSFRLQERDCHIQGVDGSGWLWTFANNGQRIAAWDGERWRTYGSAEGWLPLPATEYLSPGVGDGLVTDGGGYVWLATGSREIRRFDRSAGRWESLPAEEVGFTRAYQDGFQGYFLTDIAVGAGRQIWISGCLGAGESLAGDGIRRWSNVRWWSVTGAESGCIFDLEVDRQGRMWAGSFDALWRFEGVPARQTIYPLPPHERKQFISKIDLDARDVPWVEVITYGAAHMFGSVSYLHLDGEEWVSDYAPGDYAPASRALDAAGNAWFCKQGGLYQLADGELALVGALQTYDCLVAVDGEDRIWVAVPVGQDAGIWYGTIQP